MRNLKKAKSQPTVQETGFNSALEGFKGKPYVDGVTLVYTHTETWVATPEPKNVKKGSVVDITKEDDDDDMVVLKPLIEDTTPKVSKVIPEEIQTYAIKDEVINVYTYDAEQFAEIITLDGESQRKGESIKK